MTVLSGIDVLEKRGLTSLSSGNIGLIVHPASVNSRLRHTLRIFLDRLPNAIKAVFGPQHGIYAETQDNMREWDSFRDPETGIPFYSLYGENRKPTIKMLEGIDTFVFDLQDVGSRYYTFIWTMFLSMEAAAENDIRFVVLDRPNPINGETVSGPLIDPGYESFVGLKSIPVRHGLTIGELAIFFNEEFSVGCELEIVPMEGWTRDMFFDRTGLPWVMPSPNMPTLNTALVYPGGCLLEGANVSEGRGTTIPFELMGAPYINSKRVIKALKLEGVDGAVSREAHFIPTFNKYQGEMCHGLQVHVTDRERFDPFAFFIKFLKALHRFWPDEFEWNLEPYEYEYEKPAFDILTGSSRMRRMIEEDLPYPEIEATWQDALEGFKEIRRDRLLYGS